MRKASLVGIIFAVVAFFSLFTVVPSLQAQVLDSGEACTTDAQCSSDGSIRCIQGTCGVQVPRTGTSKATIKQLQDLDKGNSVDKENLASTTDKIFNFFQGSAAKAIAGCGPTGVSSDYDGKACGSSGVAGALNKAIVAMVDNKPAATDRYIADILNSAGVAQPAYAQGIGFAALDPILETWKVFRNIAFMFFIIVFVVIGFMIMFRQKVGQTAITAQQAIPKIIIALIMVSFSYAIAGLLIDLMYVIMYLLVGLFGQETSLINLNFLQLGWHMLTSGYDAIGLIGDFVHSTLLSMTEVVATSIEWISEITFLLIIMVAITIGIFRLFFELLKTYVTLIATIAFAPILLMLGALPGRDVFRPWLMSIVGNLAAFPTVLIVLIIFDMLFNAQGIRDAGFLPPYLFGTGSGGVIPALVGLGFVLALPEVVVKVKESLGAKDTFGWMTNAAFKNLDRGQVALPIVGGLAGRGIGEAKARWDLRGQNISDADRREAITQAAQQAQGTGWNRGKTALKWYQRLREGRLTQVEDVESLLAGLRNQQGGEKK